MVVNPTDAFNFAYMRPPINDGDKPELVIPDSLQIGWSGSLPPFFCAATETAQGIATEAINNGHHTTPHAIENVMMNFDWKNIPE